MNSVLKSVIDRKQHIVYFEVVFNYKGTTKSLRNFISILARLFKYNYNYKRIFNDRCLHDQKSLHTTSLFL